MRRKPRRLIRLIGEFLKSWRNSASVSPKYSRNDMPVVDLRAEKACFVRNLGEPVPGTNIQTIVATEDPISDKRSKLQRDGTLQLDCEIRNTSTRVESMRSGNCSSRARFDAALTRSAAIFDWFVGRQFKCRQNFCEKEPCSEPLIDQHGVFAVPADAGLGCVVAFQNRTSIHITFLLSAKVAEKLVDLVELCLDHIVIVIAPRVPRDSCL